MHVVTLKYVNTSQPLSCSIVLSIMGKIYSKQKIQTGRAQWWDFSFVCAVTLNPFQFPFSSAIARVLLIWDFIHSQSLFSPPFFPIANIITCWTRWEIHFSLSNQVNCSFFYSFILDSVVVPLIYMMFTVYSLIAGTSENIEFVR